MADTDLIEIPIDDITFGVDESSGMPIVVPASKAQSEAPAQPVEAAEPVEAEAPAEKPKPKQTGPRVSEADLEAARREAAGYAAERDAARRDAELERQTRARIEAELDRSNDVAASNYWSKINADYDQLKSAIAWANDQQAQDKAILKAAFETGDSEAWSAANERIATRAAKIVALESGERAAKADIDKTARNLEAYYSNRRNPPEPREQPERQAQPEKPQPKQQTADQWIDQWPKDTTARWLKDNREFVTDPGKHQQLLAFATYYATKNGQNKLHTADFVKALNDEFHGQQDDAETDMNDETEVETPKVEEAPARKSAPAAPVSRGVPGKSATQSSSNSITLTREQFAVAPDLFPTEKDLDPDVLKKFGGQWSQTAARFQYDKNLKRAQKDGRFDPR
jgi:hypothetical protein